MWPEETALWPITMAFLVTAVVTYGTFYFTNAITGSPGPFDMFGRLRKRWRLFECPLCTMLYVCALLTAMVLALVGHLHVPHFVVVWLCSLGLATILFKE